MMTNSWLYFRLLDENDKLTAALQAAIEDSAHASEKLILSEQANESLKVRCYCWKAIEKPRVTVLISWKIITKVVHIYRVWQQNPDSI